MANFAVLWRLFPPRIVGHRLLEEQPEFRASEVSVVVTIGLSAEGGDELAAKNTEVRHLLVRFPGGDELADRLGRDLRNSRRDRSAQGEDGPGKATVEQEESVPSFNLLCERIELLHAYGMRHERGKVL